MTGVHKLKTWPAPFDAVVSGDKTFEWRQNSDRNFVEGDVVVLEEWDPMRERYTGRAVTADVGYVLESPAFGVPPGFCVFSLVDVGSIHRRETTSEPSSNPPETK